MIKRLTSSKRRLWLSQSRSVIAGILWSTPDIADPEKLRLTLEKLVKLRVLILTVLLGIGAWAYAGSEIEYTNRGLWPVLIIYTVSFINFYWIRRVKRLVIAGYTQLALDALLSTFAIHTVGSTGSIFLYLLVIIGAAAVFSSHGALRIAALCGVCYMLLATGIIPTVDGEKLASAPQDVLAVYISLIAIALASGWAAKQLEIVGSIADERARDINELVNRHNQLFEDLAEGIITVDLSSTVTSINQAACAIMGLSELDADKFLGRPLPAIFDDHDVSGVDSLLAREFDPKNPGELTLVNNERETEVHLSYTVRELRNEAGTPTGQIFIFNDVSHLRRMEKKLSLHEQMTKLLADDKTVTDHAIEEINEKLCLVGESQAMRDLFSLVSRVAESDASVLINGESGTGKELIARAIHVWSNRHNKPFVAVNCGAIPETLIESELFGHKRGSFTGAVRDNPGLFRQANGGTIFLDEIGELPLHLQSKLLRVLQERTVRPVGDVHDMPVDVRVIAATNRKLRQDVEEGLFREDLYYRLNVVNIVVPPLRDRKEDIPLLVRYFMLRYKEEDQVMPQISPAAFDILMLHDFPGNIRELENLIERAMVLGGQAILPEHLPDEIRKAVLTARSNGSGSTRTETTIHILPINLEQQLAEIEREYLVKALEQSDGVKKRAAAMLGLNFRSFRYRLKKYDLAGSDSGD